MSIILGFDVSNSTCSVAISKNQQILAYQEDNRPSMQAENLLLLIEKVLKSISYDYEDVDYLAFTNGPGSFTGIRIGLASAEGILMASKKINPVVISNFDMSYYRILKQIKSFDKALILLNAYRRQLYYQEFDYDGTKSEYGIVDVNKVNDLIRKHKTKQLAIAGSGLIEVYEQVSELPNTKVLPRFARVRAAYICRYADEKIKNNDFGEVAPLYIRPPDAIAKNH